MKKVALVVPTILFVFLNCAYAQHGLPTLNPKIEAPHSGVIALKINDNLDSQLNMLKETFETSGSAQITLALEEMLKNPESLKKWKKFATSTEAKVLDVKVHANETKAVEWMNKRFARMGLQNVKFNAIIDNSQDDPTKVDESKIEKYKWIRYVAGPGVALFATVFNMPETATGSGNYFLLMLPSAGVGVTSVLLEYQFAHPKINANFWQHVWRFGGRIMGRVTNIAVNFLYGMSLYAGGNAFAYIPTLWGGEAIPYMNDVTLQAAATTAFVGGLIFHLAMGQYQTDISYEVQNGASNATEVYKKESVGVVWNNGFRVTSFALGSDTLQQYGLGAWFMWKTLPQFYQTNIKSSLQDRRIRKRLNTNNSSESKISRCLSFLRSKFG